MFGRILLCHAIFTNRLHSQQLLPRQRHCPHSLHRLFGWKLHEQRVHRFVERSMHFVYRWNQLFTFVQRALLHHLRHLCHRPVRHFGMQFDS